MGISFISSFGLSLTLWATPGAVTTEAFRRALMRGVYAVLFILIGSLVGDAFWAIATYFGAAFLVQHTFARLILGAIESLIQLSLAWQTLKDAWGKSALSSSEKTHHCDFITGALLSLTSPFTVTFWLTINATTSSAIRSTTHGIDMFFFFVSFLLAAILWGLLLSVLVTVGHRFTRPIIFRWLNLGCSLALAYFGISLLSSTLHLLQSSGLFG
jgi:threonine/homoserine/homoserine lactone efflux protein